MDSQLQGEKQKTPFLASFGEDKNASSESSPRPVRVKKEKKTPSGISGRRVIELKALERTLGVAYTYLQLTFLFPNAKMVANLRCWAPCPIKFQEVTEKCLKYGI